MHLPVPDLPENLKNSECRSLVYAISAQNSQLQPTAQPNWPILHLLSVQTPDSREVPTLSSARPHTSTLQRSCRFLPACVAVLFLFPASLGCSPPTCWLLLLQASGSKQSGARKPCPMVTRVCCFRATPCSHAATTPANGGLFYLGIFSTGFDLPSRRKRSGQWLDVIFLLSDSLPFASFFLQNAPFC